VLATSSCQLDFKATGFSACRWSRLPNYFAKKSDTRERFGKVRQLWKLYVVIILLGQPGSRSGLLLIKNSALIKLICIMLVRKNPAARYWKKLKKIYIFTKNRTLPK
jgi:hypothetical protein